MYIFKWRSRCRIFLLLKIRFCPLSVCYRSISVNTKGRFSRSEPHFTDFSLYTGWEGCEHKDRSPPSCYLEGWCNLFVFFSWHAYFSRVGYRMELPIRSMQSNWNISHEISLETSGFGGCFCENAYAFFFCWLSCSNIGNIANSSTLGTRSKIFAEVNDAYEVSLPNLESELFCSLQNCLFKLMVQLSWTKLLRHRLFFSYMSMYEWHIFRNNESLIITAPFASPSPPQHGWGIACFFVSSPE